MPAKPIELDLRRDLPKVREQMGSLPVGMCLYSAPCGIGAMMSPEERRKLVNDGLNGRGIGNLIRGEVVSVPEGQESDFACLQASFDCGRRAAFEATVATLEAKYLQQAA